MCIHVRRLDLIEHAVHVASENVPISQNRSNFPCDACDKLLLKKVIFQTNQAGAHDGNQYLIQLKKNLKVEVLNKSKSVRQKRMYLCNFVHV